MLRLLMVTTLVAGGWLSVRADDPPKKGTVILPTKPSGRVMTTARVPDKTATSRPAAALKVGSAAPALKVTKWLRGDAAPVFEPGKVYVVEFWATWCGPCIGSMPHLSELQEEYKDKGLTIIGVTSGDPNNSEQQVTDFVKERGAIQRYTVAWCADQVTNDEYMKASGQSGIPCSFVVDKKGQVAFIGHPVMLDEVLPKVLEGKWNGPVDAAAMEKIFDTFFENMQKAQGNPAEGLKHFLELEKSHPKMAAQFVDQKLMFLLQTKKLDEAEQLFQDIRKAAAKKKDGMKLASISRMWTAEPFNPQKRNLKIATEAVDEAVQLSGGKDLSTLVTAAQVHHAAGEKAKASTYADKAVEVAPERLRDQVKQYVERFKK